jgi:pimeloyl-ACP methyl ester carboxylesterase
MAARFVAERFTASGVRLRLRLNAGRGLWLLVPGGPGIGSDSMGELADLLPGSVWSIDLPGDGSNVAASDRFDLWPTVLVEAVRAIPDAVVVGHSVGAMQVLLVPEIEEHAAAIVLISGAPDHRAFVPLETLAREHPDDAAVAAYGRFIASPTDASARAWLLASAGWSFVPPYVEKGRKMLARLPISCPPMLWSARHFDGSYHYAWWPTRIPVLIVSGSQDQLVDQTSWSSVMPRGDDSARAWISDAAHYPWIENPAAVRKALTEFADASTPGQ